MVTILGAIAGTVISLAIAFVILRHHQNRPQNLTFAVLMIFIAAYSVFNYLALIATTEYYAFFWSKMVLYSSIPAGPLFLFFVGSLVKNKFFSSIKGQIIVLVWVVVNMILVFNGMIFESVVIIENNPVTKIGAAMPSFGLLQIGSILIGIVLLILRYIHSSGLIKLQTRLVLFGVSISFLATLFVTIILPNFFRVNSFVSLSPFFLSITGLTIAYAIIRHRLFDIRVILRRSFVYTAMVAVVTVLYIAFIALGTLVFEESGATRLTAAIVTGVIVALGYQPLLNFLNRVTERLFFKEKYNYQKAISQFSELTSSTIRLNAILVGILS